MRLKLKESCKCGAVFEYEESGEGTNPLYFINNFSDRHKECRSGIKTNLEIKHVPNKFSRKRSVELANEIGKHVKL